MFVKKNSTLQLPKIVREKIKQEIQTKQLNHQFFLLVRDQKYQEAYSLGIAYLEYFPENHAIQRFCYFIQHNREELLKMVDEELNYTDQESEQSSEQDDDQDEDQYDKQTVVSSISSATSKKSINTVKSKVQRGGNSSKCANSSKSLSSCKSSSSVISKGKQNSQFCKIHKWNHICKNVNCPNKKK